MTAGAASTPADAAELDPADAAELDVLLWALVSDYETHRQHCRSCAASRQLGGLPCRHVGRAIEEVLSWRAARILLSRAEALRAAANEAA